MERIKHDVKFKMEIPLNLNVLIELDGGKRSGQINPAERLSWGTKFC